MKLALQGLPSYRFKPLQLVLCLHLWCTSPSAFSQNTDKSTLNKLEYADYSKLQQELLDFIGRARQRIWITTDYLTDGEICSALYLANFRKIDVQVLLGRRMSNQYMSRLKFLKDQAIPVFLKPDTPNATFKTELVSDQSYFATESDLNFMNRSVSISAIKTEDTSKIQEFAKIFSQDMQKKMDTTLRPIPLVGKSGGKGRIYDPDSDSPSASTLRSAGIPTPEIFRSSDRKNDIGNNPDVYFYDPHRNQQLNPPEGVAKKLPKATIQQQRSQNPNLMQP